MRTTLSLLAFAFTAVILVNPVWAAPQTVTLEVSNMTCSVCPITVKKALQKVPGVRNVQASYERKEARVTFENTQASVAKLEEATFEAGYPAKLKAAKK